MTFQPGVSGNPSGRPKEKRVKAAIVRLADQHPDKIEKVAAAMLLAASKGDVQAATWVRDTMDGKPAQAIVGDDEHPPVLGYREWLAWMIQDGIAIAGRSIPKPSRPGELLVDCTEKPDNINDKLPLGEGVCKPDAPG